MINYIVSYQYRTFGTPYWQVHVKNNWTFTLEESNTLLSSCEKVTKESLRESYRKKIPRKFSRVIVVEIDYATQWWWWWWGNVVTHSCRLLQQMDELTLSLTGGVNGYKVQLRDLYIKGASNYTVEDIKLGSPFQAIVRMPALILDAHYSRYICV